MEEQIFFNPIKILLLNSSVNVELNRISYIHTRVKCLQKRKDMNSDTGHLTKKKRERERKEERKIVIVRRSSSTF